MINRNLFHSPVKSFEDRELDLQSMYCGQKVQIIGYQTVFEEKNADEEDRIVEGCSTGSRHLFLNKKGYLDSFNGKNEIPDMIVLNDSSLLLKNFKICEVV